MTLTIVASSDIITVLEGGDEVYAINTDAAAPIHSCINLKLVSVNRILNMIEANHYLYFKVTA